MDFHVKWVINDFVFMPTSCDPFNNCVYISYHTTYLLNNSCSCLGSWPIY